MVTCALDDVELFYSCNVCGSVAGAPCMTSDGKILRHPHPNRERRSDLGLDGDGHKAYPPGACSPVHPSGCLRCLEAENATLREQLQDADTQIATLKAHAVHLGEQLDALLVKK